MNHQNEDLKEQERRRMVLEMAAKVFASDTEGIPENEKYFRNKATNVNDYIKEERKRIASVENKL